MHVPAPCPTIILAALPHIQGCYLTGLHHKRACAAVVSIRARTWIEPCKHACHRCFGPAEVGGAGSQHTCRGSKHMQQQQQHTPSVIAAASPQMCKQTSSNTVRLKGFITCNGLLLPHTTPAGRQAAATSRCCCLRSIVDCIKQLRLQLSPSDTDLAYSWVAGSRTGRCTVASSSSPAPRPATCLNQASTRQESDACAHITATYMRPALLWCTMWVTCAVCCGGR